LPFDLLLFNFVLGLDGFCLNSRQITILIKTDEINIQFNSSDLKNFQIRQILFQHGFEGGKLFGGRFLLVAEPVLNFHQTREQLLENTFLDRRIRRLAHLR
jgi:hypothetical protein